MKFKAAVFAFSFLLASESVWSETKTEPYTSVPKLFQSLLSASKEEGTQIGFVADPHSEKSDEICANKYTFPSGSKITAYTVIQSSGLKSEMKDFKGMGHQLQSLLGRAPVKTPGGEKSWFVFVYDAASGHWKNPDLGVDAVTLKDGDTFGFSYTTYDSNFNPINPPRNLESIQVCENLNNRK